MTSAYQLYKDLEVDKDATDQEIKKQYRLLARQHHPDKGGDSERFKKIGHAYEILSDTSKKRQYDMMGGNEHPSGGGGGGGFPFPGFPSGFATNFGSGMFGSQGPNRKTTTVKPTIYRLVVSLDDIYTGTTKSITIQHTLLCASCTGSGIIGNINGSCSVCRGTGQETYMRSLGPGMMQQVSQQCTTCFGSGRFIPEKDKCRPCAGQGFTKTKSQLDIRVPPGAHENSVLYKDTTKGGHVRDRGNKKLISKTLFVVLVSKKRPNTLRYGEHIVTTLKISIWEALCGVDRKVTVLGNETIRLKTPLNSVCVPGSYLMCAGKGLPLMKNTKERGSLCLKLEIQFPAVLTTEQRTLLKPFVTTTTTSDVASTVGDIVNETYLNKILESAKERQEKTTEEPQFRQTQGSSDCRTQ